MKGDDFVLLVGDGASGFDQLGGLRATEFTINGEMVNITSKDSSNWRQLIATGGGVKSISISGGGVWLGGAYTTLCRTLAMSGNLEDFQLDDGDEVLEGAFQVTSFQVSGDQGAETTYTISLESGDVPTFT